MSDSDRVMFITGGSRGIGAATARLAAADGWSVGVGYRSAQGAADEVVEACRAAGAAAVAVQCEVADEDSVVGAFDAVGKVEQLL